MINVLRFKGVGRWKYQKKKKMRYQKCPKFLDRQTLENSEDQMLQSTEPLISQVLDTLLCRKIFLFKLLGKELGVPIYLEYHIQHNYPTCSYK